jgi:glutaminase
VTTDGEIFYAGDHDQPFALQSISEIVVYCMDTM